MEAADDACFAIVDIEDAVKKRVIRWDQVASTLNETTLGASILSKAQDYLAAHGPSLTGDSRDEALAQMVRVYFIADVAISAKDAFVASRDIIMNGEFDTELIKVSNAQDLVKSCKSFARDKVYPCGQIVKLEMRGRRVISDLMSFYWMGASDAGPDGPSKDVRSGMARRAFGLISPNYRRIFAIEAKRGAHPIDYLRLQLVTDQVCGMTDGYACRLHQEIYGG
jgi:dGTPase